MFTKRTTISENGHKDQVIFVPDANSRLVVLEDDVTEQDERIVILERSVDMWDDRILTLEVTSTDLQDRLMTVEETILSESNIYR